MKKTLEQKIQEDQYKFPYHHLVNLNYFDNHKTLHGGLNYYGYINKVIGYINQENFCSLLDIGCGDGKLIFELAQKNKTKKLIGIDYSEKAILFARAFNYENGSEFMCGDVCDLNGSFDVITIIEVLEHIPDDQMKNITDSIYNLLSPNGRLIVSVPSVNDPLNSKHYRHYILDSLVQTLDLFKLEKHSFVISNNKFYVFLVKLSGKLSNFKLIRSALLKIAKKFFFKVQEKTGTHIVAVFRKI